MEENHFKFKLKLGNFEFEIEGDKNFVEKTMNRYEGRFLPRFQELMSKIKPPDSPKSNGVVRQEQVSTQIAGRAPEIAAGSPVSEAADFESKKEKWDKKERMKRSRGRKHPRDFGSNRVTPPATAPPKDRGMAYAPYLPDDAGAKTPANKENASPAAKSDTDKGKKPAGIDPAALKQIFDKLSPRTHHEKILVFAYSLDDGSENSYFTVNSIKECYETVSIDPAGNINQVLNHATRTGFLNKKQRGRQVRYSMTSKGKHFVERGLKQGE